MKPGRATPQDFRELGRDRASLIAPALIQSVTTLIHSCDDPERDVPDGAFAERMTIAFNFVDEMLPGLRAIGCTKRELRHFREGARDHFLHEIDLAKAAASAAGRPN